LQEALKEGTRTSTGSRSRYRLLRTLVVVEIALAMVLVIGGGLLTKAFYQLTRTDVGFDTNNVLTLRISLPGWKYSDRNQQSTLYERIVKRSRALPGVKYVGGINILPLTGSSFGVLVSSSAQASPQDHINTNCSSVLSDYFQAMGISLIKGRYFGEQDTLNSNKVVIVDKAMADSLWPTDDPIGKSVIFQGRPREVVGVVGVVGEIKKGESKTQANTQIYVPHSQFDFPWPYMHFVVRTATGDPASLASSLRRVIWSEDKDQPVVNMRTIDQLISTSVSRERFSMILLVSFATMSLILAAIGIYGVMAYSVAQRTHEIGVRRALGAPDSALLGMITGQALILIAVGIAIGLTAAFTTTRVLSTLLYGVSATDSVIFIVGSLLLAGVALLASYVPARKAMKVDPMVILRNE
ncbi:MAG: ABC transporter permease, partial [Blastocatellia bacterium]